MIKISGIYKITNKLNLMIYVGRSVNTTKRLKQHLWDLCANRHHNHKLQNSFNKYGEDNFTFSIACEAEFEDLIELEQLAIDEGISSGRCFNINTNAEYGGVAGRVWTEEQIENIKKGQQLSDKFAKTSLKNQSKEDRARALELAKTPEAVAKRVATRKANGFDVNDSFKESRELRAAQAVKRALKAIDWVIETREPMREANKLFGINQRMWRKVIPIWELMNNKKFDLPLKAIGNKNPRHSGIVIGPLGKFDSISSAHKETMIPYSTIARWCMNNTNEWSYSKSTTEHLNFECPTLNIITIS
jgi:group I intron endonuclease